MNEEKDTVFTAEFSETSHARMEYAAWLRGTSVPALLLKGLKLLLLEERVGENGGRMLIESADGTRQEIITPE